MPRALHIESVEAAFGERAKTMGAKFLESVKLIVDPGDCHDQLVDFDAQCFTIAQVFGIRNRNKGSLSIPRRASGRKTKRILRSWGVTFMTPDRDTFVVNKAATQVAGHRQ